MNDREYHDHELRKHYREEVAKTKEFQKLPKKERDQEVALLVEYCTTEPSGRNYFVNQLDWLMGGPFGYAANWYADRIVNADKRTNKRAQLFYLAALDCFGVPHYYATKAWYRLSKAQQAELNGLIDQVILDRLDVLKEIAEYEVNHEQG